MVDAERKLVVIRVNSLKLKTYKTIAESFFFARD